METRQDTTPPKGTGRKRAADSQPVQDIVRRVEEDIVFRVYHPRERLVEDELMQRFGAKRHIVRQALAELERDGLVMRKPNSGAQVRALTAKEATELYAVREILETSCVKLIALPVDARLLAPIEKIQREHAAAIKGNDVRAVFRANLAFHAAIFRLCGNDALIEAIADFARRTHPVRLTTLVTEQYLEQARSQHDEILQALLEGDRARLVALSARHLKPSREAYLRTIEHLNN
ncbi:MAG: GntR family transcriptional regulator [Proteobacteria bacterium]|nr:GntR family transcriptional regulator [Pseudomonadota bacterium]